MIPFRNRPRVFLLVQLAALAFSGLAVAPASAQDSVVIARVAAKDVATFRYAEVFHETGAWVFPDVGYVDYGSGDYREFFAGFGRTLFRSPRASMTGELLFLQAAGEAAESARYVLPWVLVGYRLSTKIAGEAVYFPYLPLNSSAHLQQVFERAKLE